MPRKKREKKANMTTKKCRNLEVKLGPYTAVYDERADDSFLIKAVYAAGGNSTVICFLDNYDELIEILSKTKELVDEMKKDVDKQK